MVKVNRFIQKKPLLEKIEQGSLGGTWRPSSRPAFNQNAKMIMEVNDGLRKAGIFGKALTEDILLEVFDVRVGSKSRIRKRRGF